MSHDFARVAHDETRAVSEDDASSHSAEDRSRGALRPRRQTIACRFM